MKTKGKIIIGALVLIVGIVAFEVFYFSKAPGREAVELEEMLRGRNHEQAGEAGMRSLSLANMERLMQQEVASPKLMVLQHSLHFRYPTTSRPLTRKMHDLLSPMAVEERKHPYYASWPPAEGQEPDAYYTWSGPSYVTTGTDPITATLQIFSKDEEPVKPHIKSAEIYADKIFGGAKIGEVSYQDNGKGVYTFSWTPRAGERMHWGELTMKVKFDLLTMKDAEVLTVFNSTPTRPAEFTGKYFEILEDGSLLIGVEMDVKKAGKYIIEANLFGKDDGEPYHWVYANEYVEAGRQVVNLKFFGLVFHDREFSEGRLVLRNLRGRRLNLPYDPRQEADLLARGADLPVTSEPLEEWLTPGIDFVTGRSYDVSEFTKSEYDGPDKRERMNVIREYARDWEANHGRSEATEIDG